MMGRTIVWLLVLAAGGTLAGLSSCSDAEPKARARRVVSRTELIGGPSALAEVGDYLLENDKIRVVIQDKGFSRGFGVYGGGLIDADRVRPVAEAGQAGGHGRDQFGELFPVFFLQALVPEKVEVVADGSDGGPARVRVSGTGGDFLSMTRALNQAILNSHELPDKLPDFLANPLDDDRAPRLAYDVTYELAPGDRHVKIVTRMTNVSGEELRIPWGPIAPLLNSLLGKGDEFQVPMGFVLLFGAGNHVFAPGYGYDLRFSLEEAYQVEGPALPGLLTPGLVSTSRNGISYGFFALPDETVEGFAAHRFDKDGANIYEKAYGIDVGEDTMLLPFMASAFTGAFYAQAPETLAAGESFAFTTYFVVGDGDAASVMNTVHRLRGTPTGELIGEVRDTLTTAPVEGASVVVYGPDGRPVNQFFTDASGHFRGHMPAGRYTARIEKDPMLSLPVPFEVVQGERTYVTLGAPTPARVAVQVTDETGTPLPARVTVVGTVEASYSGHPLRKWLFDLAAGQRWRTSDHVPDDPDDPRTRRFIEARAVTPDGHALLEVQPGREYEVFVSRGPEYTVQRQVVKPVPGRTVHVAAILRRVVDTTGYIGADFHIHAGPSLDSDVALHDRVVTGAAEGLEYLVATDHNYVTDYRPYIERAGLERWVSSMVGIELTTLESGHFNGYPIRRDAGDVTRGSFEWSLRPPAEIFAELRARGAFGPDDTVVQVNHPRDSILGYFDQYELSPLDATLPLPPCPEELPAGWTAGEDCVPVAGRPGLDLGALLTPNGSAFADEHGRSRFSFAFDAIEVLNGGLPVQIHHERLSRRADVSGLDEKVRDALRRYCVEQDPGRCAEPPILCEDGDVAFPGVVDDWFNLLNLGHRYTAVANSDSHHDDDIGYPRTYVRVDRDDPATVGPLEVARAVRAHRAILTNGPFIELFVDGQPIGADVRSQSGEVEVRVKVAAAPWVDVRRGVLFANGDPIERFDVELVDGRFEWTKTVRLPRDAWLVAEVEGDESLFPVVKPIDVAPLLLNDAFTSLAGAFNLGGGPLASLEPSRTAYWTALALTNPIWVDVDGGGFDPPGIRHTCECLRDERDRCLDVGVVVKADPATDARADGLRAARPTLQRTFGRLPRLRGDLSDVRVIFEHFGGHAH